MQAKLCPLGILFKPSEAGLLLLRGWRRTLDLSTPPRAEMGIKDKKGRGFKRSPENRLKPWGLASPKAPALVYFVTS